MQLVHYAKQISILTLLRMGLKFFSEAFEDSIAETIETLGLAYLHGIYRVCEEPQAGAFLRIQQVFPLFATS